MTRTALTTMCFVLGFAVMLTACKDDEVEPTKTYGKVYGQVQADLNENANGLENAPQGTKVIARVSPADYTNNPDFNVAYEDVLYTTEIGANGRYSFSNIEAYSNPVTVTISFSDFEYNTTNAGGGTTTRHVYTTGDVQVTLLANETRVADAVYAY